MTMRWRKSGLGADFAAGVTTLGPGLSLGYGADGSVYIDAVADAGNVDWTLGYGTYDARYAPLSHASRHASGGDDPITPAMIGAVAVSDLAGYVPTSRQVIAGAGLTGGGALSGNITINVASHPGTANTVGTLVVEADRVGVALGNTSTTAAPGNHPLGGHPGYLDVTKGGTGLEITAIGRAQAVMLDPGGSSTALQRLEAPTGAVRYLSASDTGVISWQTISLSGSVPSVGAGWIGRVLQVTGASTYGWGLRLPNVSGPVGQALVSVGAPGGILEAQWGDVDWQYIANKPDLTDVWRAGVVNGPVLGTFGGDLNDASGLHAFYASTSATNRPPSGNSNIIGFGIANYATQLAARDDWFYIRQQEAGVWGPWRQIAERDWALAQLAPISGATFTGFVNVHAPGNIPLTVRNTGAGAQTSIAWEHDVGGGWSIRATSSGDFRFRRDTDSLWHMTLSTANGTDTIVSLGSGSGTDQGYLSFSWQRNGPVTGQVPAAIYMSGSGGGSFPFDGIGHLVLQPRSNASRSIVFMTGNPPALAGYIDHTGALYAEGSERVATRSWAEFNLAAKVHSHDASIVFNAGNVPVAYGGTGRDMSGLTGLVHVASGLFQHIAPNPGGTPQVLQSSFGSWTLGTISGTISALGSTAGQVLQSTGSAAASYNWGVKLPNVSGPVGQPLVAQGAPGGVVTIDYGSVDAQYITGTFVNPAFTGLVEMPSANNATNMRFGQRLAFFTASSGYTHIGFWMAHDGTNFVNTHASIRGSALRISNTGALQWQVAQSTGAGPVSISTQWEIGPDGVLAAGSVPASRVSAGAFGAGNFSFTSATDTWVSINSSTSSADRGIKFTHNGGDRSAFGYTNSSGVTWIEAFSHFQIQSAGVVSVRVAANGNVGIGYSTNQSYKLAVNGSGYYAGALTVSGNATVNGTLTAAGLYDSTVASTRRIKDAVEDFCYNREALLALRPRQWRYNFNAPDMLRGAYGAGFVAEEVHPIFADERREGVFFNRITAQLVWGWQEHDRTLRDHGISIETNRQRIERLELENAELRHRLAMAEAAWRN